MLMGAFVLSGSLRNLERNRDMFRWPATACSIIRSAVVNHPQFKRNYEWTVDYRYVFDGREFRSNRYNFFNFYGGLNQKFELVRLHPVGMQTTSWVNPADPTDAVLDPQSGFTPRLVVIPIVLGSGLFWGVLSLVRRKAK